MNFYYYEKMLGFVASVIESVAWPITFISALLLLRPTLNRLVSNLKKLKLGGDGIHLELNESLGIAEKELRSSASGNSEKSAEDEELAERLKRVAINAPAAAITESFKYLEAAVVYYAEKEGLLPLVESRKSFSGIHLEKFLANSGLLKEARGFRELRMVRNRAAHNIDEQLSRSDAERYVDLVFELSAHLKNAQNPLRPANPTNPAAAPE